MNDAVVRLSLRSFFTAVLLFPAVLPAAELTAVGISLPFFDAEGRPTHKLLARRGTVKGAVQKLTDVDVVYFSATEKDKIVQRVQAAEAIWNTTKETLTGDRSIIVTTEENRLTGEGFDFALATSLLHIHRAFTMENREVRLTSDRATVELLVERSGDSVRVRDVKRCEAFGHLAVVVLPTARKKYPYEQAFSEIAIYDGAKQTIELPKKIRTVNKGREGTIDHFIYELREDTKK